jgi:hypothetical protein
LRLGTSVSCVDELLSQETKNPDPLAKGESDVLRLKSDISIEGVGDGQPALSELSQLFPSGGAPRYRQVCLELVTQVG